MEDVSAPWGNASTSSPTGNGTDSTDSLRTKTITQSLEKNNNASESVMESIFPTSHREDLLYSLEEEMNATTSSYVIDTSSPASPVWLYAVLTVSLTVTMLLCVALAVIFMRRRTRNCVKTDYDIEDESSDEQGVLTDEIYDDNFAPCGKHHVLQCSMSSDVIGERGGVTDSHQLAYRIHGRAPMPLPRTNIPTRERSNLAVINANTISEDVQSLEELCDGMSEDEETPPVPHRSYDISMDDSEGYQPLLHCSTSLTDHIHDDFVMHGDAPSMSPRESITRIITDILLRAGRHQSAACEEAKQEGGGMSEVQNGTNIEPLVSDDNSSHISLTSSSGRAQQRLIPPPPNEEAKQADNDLEVLVDTPMAFAAIVAKDSDVLGATGLAQQRLIPPPSSEEAKQAEYDLEVLIDTPVAFAAVVAKDSDVLGAIGLAQQRLIPPPPDEEAKQADNDLEVLYDPPVAFAAVVAKDSDVLGATGLAQLRLIPPPPNEEAKQAGNDLEVLYDTPVAVAAVVANDSDVLRATGDRSSVEPIRPAKRDSSVYRPNFLTVHDEPRKSSKSLKQRDVAIVTRYENCDVTQAVNSDLDAQDMPQDHISRLQVNEEGGTFVDNLPKVPMTIDIPAGAVRTQTNIAIIQSFNRRFMPMVDDNEKIIGPLIHFCPHRLQLEKAMTVTLRLPHLNPSNSYHILYSPTDIGDECEWIDLTEPGHSVAGITLQVNANAKEVILSLLHYCVFIVIEKATGERTEAIFCQLQASLLLHPTSDMVQVNVKVSPDDTDDVLTEFDVTQHLCVRNNEKALELTVETSLFEPPAGFTIVPVTPLIRVVPFMSVWRDKSPSATFHMQLKRPSHIGQDVFLVCHIIAQQKECDEDAVTLDLSRILQLMAKNRQSGDLPQNRPTFPSGGYKYDAGRDINPLPRVNSSPKTQPVNKQPERGGQQEVGTSSQHNDQKDKERNGGLSKGQMTNRSREDQTVVKHMADASPQLQLCSPSREATDLAEGGDDWGRMEQTQQPPVVRDDYEQLSLSLMGDRDVTLPRARVPLQVDGIPPMHDPSQADMDESSSQNVIPHTLITDSAFATSDNAELNMQLIDKVFLNPTTSHFIARN